jgi:site-specific DNA-adenine methylase
MSQQKGYYDFRKHYNESKEKDMRDLYLLSCYSMNHLIRFNQNNEFNASCGSTQRYIYEKIQDAYPLLQNVEIQNQNLFDIDFSVFTENDFLYFDPPYSNTTAVYNEKRAFGGWTIEDDLRLFQILDDLNSRGVKWALSNVFINRGKENSHLVKWVHEKEYNVYHLNRNYNPFSHGKSNNDEVLICNYIKEDCDEK